MTSLSFSDFRKNIASLEAKIENARQEYREGRTLHFENAAAAQKWMDEL